MLIATIDASIGGHPRARGRLSPLRVVADEQLVAVGGSLAATSVGPAPADARDATAELARLAFDSAERPRKRAVSAASPDVARVLASMSAGLSQLATAFGAVRS